MILRGNRPGLQRISAVLLILGLLHSAYSQDKSSDPLYPSRFLYESKTEEEIAQHEKLHPTDIDVFKDIELEKLWNQPEDTPSVLQEVLPKDVFFINHQLAFTAERTLVKINNGVNAVIARAFYEFNGISFSTNVIFGKNAVLQNIDSIMNEKNPKKWLVRKTAKAAILFLHGGGTKTTGAAVATNILNHYSSTDVDVLSLDLPMHSEGPRKIMSMENDILALGAFARKYIPPHVPLFVYGHSWGAVFSDALMRMTGERQGVSFFHPNLKGVIIASPAVDPAPGQPYAEKIKEMQKRYKKANELALTKTPPAEREFWSDVIRKGKYNVNGGIASYKTILELDHTSPSSKNIKFSIPALMIVGKGDSLVYLGHEDLFHNYYDLLPNVETHYLNQRPYIFSPTKEPQTVGHILDDSYANSLDGEAANINDPIPVNFYLTNQFINKTLGSSAITDLSKDSLPHLQKYTLLANFVRIYSNDLAFRNWLKDFQITTSRIIEKERFNPPHEERKEIWENIGKAITSYLPANQFLTLLKEMAVNPAQIDFNEFKNQLSKLEESGSKIEARLMESSNLQTASDISKEILLKEIQFHNAPDTHKRVELWFLKGQKQELIDYIENISDLFMTQYAIHQIKSLYSDFEIAESDKAKTQIIRDAVNIIKNHEPLNILYKITIEISKNPFPQNKQHYIPTIQEFYDFFNSFDDGKYKKTLLKSLESMLKAKNFNQMQKTALELIPKLGTEVELTKNSIQLYRFSNKYKSYYNRSELNNSLKKFILPQSAKDQIISLFEEREIHPEMVILYNVQKIIIENSALNKIFHLKKLLEKITFKQTVEKLHTYFADTEKEILLKNLLKAQQIKKQKELAFHLFMQSFVHSGVKTPKKLEKQTMSLNSRQAIKIFVDTNFPHISLEQRDQLALDLKQHLNLSKMLQMKRIPKPEDFYRYYKVEDPLSHNKLTSYVEHTISQLEHYINKQQDLDQQLEQLRQEKHRYKKTIDNLNRHLEHHISLIKQAFDQAVASPPNILQPEYEQLKQMHGEMMDQYEKLNDSVIQLTLPVLEQKSNTSHDLLPQLFQENKTHALIENSLKKYNAWAEKHGELNNQLAAFIQNNPHDPRWSKYRDSFSFIYGDSAQKLEFNINTVSPYADLFNEIRNMAKTEAKILSLEKKQHENTVNYFNAYPHHVTHELIEMNAWNLLNNESNGDYIEYLDQHIHLIKQIFTQWENMIKLPPRVPLGLCRNIF